MKTTITLFPQPDDPASTRIEGGAVRIIEELTNQIISHSKEEANATLGTESTNRILLNTPIASCKLLNMKENDETTLVQLTTITGQSFLSRKVVFAVPPKIISESITFDPPLTKAKTLAMAQSKTWMAGVTKVALVYQKKFWTSNYHSNLGLPSSLGPAFQVYDSSTKDGSIVALTFFVHVPQNDDILSSTSNDTLLAQRVAEQMSNYWKMRGLVAYQNQALSYTNSYVHRWPMDIYISGTETRPPQIHPHPMPILALSTPEWDHRLWFAGTETDRTSPGVMEGAVGAAKRVLKSLFS
jgi:monoamine oxidase